jgi:hypothetical protein
MKMKLFILFLQDINYTSATVLPASIIVPVKKCDINRPAWSALEHWIPW